MAMASSWGVRTAAAAARLDGMAPAKRESPLSVPGCWVLRWPSLRSERAAPPALSCHRGGGGGVSEWDWIRWSHHFSEMEQAERFASVLKFQLEDAIEKEDYFEAAKLKAAILEATPKDAVAEVMSELEDAIEEERYYDASRLSRLSGSSVVGWWVGWSTDSDDPFGKIVRITPAVGRFVARSYSPRQLLNASSGTPLFEIFLVKDDAGTYSTQVVYLQPAKGNSKLSSAPQKAPYAPPISENSSMELPANETEMKKENDSRGIKDSSEEGIRSVINFFKERIPGFKVKVLNVSGPDEMKKDEESLEQPVQEDVENVAPEDSKDEASSTDDILHGDTDGKETDTTEGSKHTTMKLFVGGLIHNREDVFSKSYGRFPAEIKNMDRNSFILHIPGKITDPDFRERKATKIKVAAIAAQAASDLMPSDVAEAFWNSEDFPAKVSKEIREVIKLAVSQAQRRNKLSKTTFFNRIITANDSIDPFNGLYVGSFGPYGFEVVQLRRKYGHWNSTDEADDYSEIEFFEYVEAVKLTGDLNIPAGQVTFRAKIGKGGRILDRGYPPELGVVASYRGQGRIAGPGFKNPKWVDGELVLLNGQGFGPHVRGTELGFLYVVPEHSFLVLFDRLKLPQ